MRHEEILYVALGAAAVGLLFARTRKIVGAGTMQDTPVSLENVRKGIARGWYSAQLCTVDGRPAVKLSGTANGKPYSDYYPVSQATWDALKADGVQQIGRVCGVGRLSNFPWTPDAYTDIYIFRNGRQVDATSKWFVRNKQQALDYAKKLARGRAYDQVFVGLVHGEEYVEAGYTPNGNRIY